MSCTKTGYVKGTVYESGSNTPIPNANVLLREQYSHAGASNIIANAITDSKGEYKITYTKIGGRSYYAIGSNFVDGVEEKLGSSKLAKNFSLVPSAFLKVYANKTSTSSNYLQINFPTGSPLKQPVLSSNASSPYNTLIHSSYYSLEFENYPSDSPCYFMKANSTYTISWQVYDNVGPTTTTGTAQFNPNKGDTISYTITFN